MRGSFRGRNGRKMPFLALLAGFPVRPWAEPESFRDPTDWLWAHGGGAGGSTGPTGGVSGRFDFYFLAAWARIMPENGVPGASKIDAEGCQNDSRGINL